MEPVGRDGIHRLKAAVIHLDHTLALESAQCLPQTVGLGEVDTRCERQLALSHIGQERIEDVEQLSQRQRPSFVVEQGKRDECGGGDGSGVVDAIGNVKGHARDNSRRIG